MVEVYVPLPADELSHSADVPTERSAVRAAAQPISVRWRHAINGGAACDRLEARALLSHYLGEDMCQSALRPPGLRQPKHHPPLDRHP
jgi:hypothetical protein